MIEILDLAVILGSSCQEVFLDMVKRYPGAQQFYDHVETLPCECGDPHCSRRAMQHYLKEWFDNDRDKVALFFQGLSLCDQTPSAQIIQTVLADMGLIVSTGEERSFVEHFEQMLRERGISFKKIDLN